MNKLVVTQEVDSIKYQLEGLTMKELVEYFAEKAERYGEEAFLAITYDFDDVMLITINVKREETDQEYEYRMAAEDRAKEYRRKQFEQLKKEFE